MQELVQLSGDMKLEEWPQETLDEHGYITDRSEVVVLHRSPRKRYWGDPKFNKLPMLQDMFVLTAAAQAT